MTTTVTGWRMWAVEPPTEISLSYRPILTGPTVESRDTTRIGVPWKGVRDTATCDSTTHQPPNIECGCGVYAEALTTRAMSHTIEAAIELKHRHNALQQQSGPFPVPAPPMLILGQIELSGRIVVDCTMVAPGAPHHIPPEYRPYAGTVPEYRAQTGELKKLWVTGLPDPTKAREISDALRRTYRLPALLGLPKGADLQLPPVPDELPRERNPNSILVSVADMQAMAGLILRNPEESQR
ncbi:hypothetical protein Q3O43_10620 [Rhodococcus aetherivorans]|uniref:hypothetical protein n=1 Tax=Rhodococcus aetherivorans TaxID=191292 RepID=UPI0026EB4A23|nr:hypothetical protein [Rhodococcus aetherivorans]WKX00717.1 hypothetical protein Q3O43_10620 [Rhodococcus aetherivorans]